MAIRFAGATVFRFRPAVVSVSNSNSCGSWGLK